MSYCVATSIKKVFVQCVLFIGFVAHALNASALEDLTIQDGETYRVSSSQEFLSLNTLRVGDNARLELPRGMTSWSLQAANAYIGHNVKIIASGVFRKGDVQVLESVNPISLKIEDAKSCASPVNGEAGLNGDDGVPGTDINLRLGLASFHDLIIDVSGGVGMDGSIGQDGQNADQSEGCKLTPGGDAGAGGRAGNGGDSGSVSIVYTTASDESLLKKARSKTTVVREPGKAGSPGRAGKPGKGSAGTYVIKKTLSGNKKWVSGGDKGAKAKNGGAARFGAKGRVDIQVLLTGSPETAQKSVGRSESKSVQSQLDELTKQYQSLLKRIEVLEKQ